MFDLRNYKILAVVMAVALLIPACGSPGQQSAISTAVAQTVQAQSPSETLTVPPATALTDTPSPLATPAASATVTATPLTQASNVELCTASASLVKETIPDGTIVPAGTTFTKVWHILNSGTCIWDSNWQLVYYGGDLMDGSAVYKFPQPAQPGETVQVPVILRAPAQGGTHTGEWMLKSPWGKVFGVGQYSVPMTVSIVVGSGTPENRRTETAFGVTAVTYSVERTCAPANTFYTITANITSNGPVKINFIWVQSDGNSDATNLLTFTEATTKSVQREWSQHKDTAPTQRWVQVIVTDPTYQEFDKVLLPDFCYYEP
ncbi:MAG: NBR1-Ig-like domain-containing protein [Anaerolineales bacterium]